MRDRRLAILSACDVGTIDLLRFPDEFIGMPGELLDLGLENVIAATWSVARGATTDVIGRGLAKLPRVMHHLAVALALAQAVFEDAGLDVADLETQGVGSRADA